ncbi:MAG: hypothetical protein CVU14_05695 [Bacteroidetes bacterium HGW-Bacteroidetes-9]|jgi:hypothetical protein|nr:MAG: hypothetical protein CVU14_05695 [Bacteroidetes bacterium HGW-Bacteroidetes-9]
MAHENQHAPLSTAERDFLEIMQQGDDFFKIELLRPARNCYRKALEQNIDTEKVFHKIAECDRLMAFENKVIIILAIVASLLILAYIVF